MFGARRQKREGVEGASQLYAGSSSGNETSDREMREILPVNEIWARCKGRIRRPCQKRGDGFP